MYVCRNTKSKNTKLKSVTVVAAQERLSTYRRVKKNSMVRQRQHERLVVASSKAATKLKKVPFIMPVTGTESTF